MKNVYCVSTMQHWDMKSDVLQSKNATILQGRCANALSCRTRKSPTIPTDTNVPSLCMFL